MVKVHAPVPSAVAVPSGVAPSKIITVLLASAVPVSVGVASLVNPPLATVPVTCVTPLVMALMAGAPGAVASTVRINGAEVTPLGFNGVVAIAVKMKVPSPRPREVIEKMPGAVSVAKPADTPPLNISTVAPAAAAMVSVGFVSFVKILPAITVKERALDRPVITGGKSWSVNGTTIEAATGASLDARIA